jgi:hypothetical protein
MNLEVETEEKQEILCPSCDKPVLVGEVQCPHCGVNMRSGETFDTQVKRTQAAAGHTGHVAGTIMLAVALLLGSTLGGGYVLHARTRMLLRTGPGLLGEPHRMTNLITRLSMIAPLAEADSIAECRAILAANREALDGTLNYIRIPAKAQSGGSEAKDVYAELQTLFDAADNPQAYAFEFAKLLLADIADTDKALVPPDPGAGVSTTKVQNVEREHAEKYSIRHYKKLLRKMAAQITSEAVDIEPQGAD